MIVFPVDTASTSVLTVAPVGIPFKNVVEIIAKAVVCAFAVTVFVTSFKLLWMQSVSNQVSPGLGLPMIVPYFAITFSFAIISIVQVSTLVNMVIKLFTGEKEASV